MSPSVVSVWMDALVGAASFSAESWLEAAGAVAAENQALDFIRRLADMPDGSGGCFTFGGSNGNLSAIAVARDVAGGRRLAAVADTATRRSTTRCVCSVSTRWWCRQGRTVASPARRSSGRSASRAGPRVGGRDRLGGLDQRRPRG